MILTMVATSRRRLTTHVAVAVWLGVFCSPPELLASVPAAEMIRTANAHFQLGVDARNGTPLEIADTRANHNHIDPRIAKAQSSGLWELRLRRAAERVVLTAVQAKSFRTETLPGDSGGLRLIWDQFGLSSAVQLKVAATVRLDADGP